MEQTLKTDWKNLTREERGKLLAKSTRIVKVSQGWRVTSQTNTSKQYVVKLMKDRPVCSCPDCAMRHKKCKHIYAVEFYVKRQINEEGQVTETKGVKISYQQDWKAYNNAQTNEKLIFMKLLKDLCGNIEQPEYKFGRPTLPISDMLFASALKVYSTFSLRRFISDFKIAKEMNLVETTCTYANICYFMQREDLTEILKQLISISASPLKEFETNFAVDSSGFSTSRFARWFDTKWGKERKYRVWLKAHLISGTKTNIITGCEITEGEVNDSPSLPRLVEETAKTFRVGEVSGDKAYSSRKNLQAIEDVGAVPFIPFKKNVRGKRASCGIWKKMYHYFIYKHDEFLEHYHKRSNVETVFHMIKTKFKDNLRSKTKTAQINELLLKILCHNICVIIQEINELGVRGEFVVEKEVIR
ncbi:MAG: transposase [archaeon]